MKQFLSELFYLLGPRKWRLFLLFMAFLIVSILEFIGIGSIGPYVQLASSPDQIDHSPLLSTLSRILGITESGPFTIALGFIIVFLFCTKSLVYWLVQRRIIKFSQNRRHDLALRLFRAYIKAPYTFHLRHNSSEAIQSITADAAAYSIAVLIPFLQVIINSMIVIGLALLILVLNPLATVLILGMILPLFFLFRFFRQRIYEWGKTARNSNEETIRSVSQSIIGIKETTVIGCGSYFIEHLDKTVADNVSAVTNITSLKIAPRIIVEATLVVFAVGFTSLFILSGQEPEELFPVFGVLGLASIRLIPATTAVANNASNLQTSRYQLDKIYTDLKEIENVLDSDPTYATSTDASNRILPFQAKIVIDGIHFRYPNADEDAIKGISLTVEKGSSIAFIGKSGAGKTTLADIILGLLTPQSGDISVDGTSIYQDVRAWQNLLGYIPQSISLNDDTIERNIAFGVPEDQINPEQLQKAIRDAQLEDLVEKLPEGVKTSVGERGVRLSGGQRQRIGIARALYHEREILVLDEATSALDNETEALVTEAIRALGNSKTLIIIAHRLSTVQHCHQLYMLSEGQVIRSGTYAEVVESVPS